MRAVPIGGPAGSDNRWQGYTHQELYDMLHSGPGTRAAGLTADTWSGLSGALNDIQQDISTGITQSGAAWAGMAADSARDALGPLGDWAQQASAAAELMQLSTTMQGELLDKARSEMPQPIPPAQPGDQSSMRSLISAQLDAERVEAAQDAAAQRAFQVMTDYESGTTDNTSTLGEFGTPPKLVVDTSPITGIPLSRSGDDPLDERGRASRPVRANTRIRPSGVAEEEPLPEREPATAVRPAQTPAEPATEPAQPTAEDSAPKTTTTTTSETTAVEPERVTTTTPTTTPTAAPTGEAAPSTSTTSTTTPTPRRTATREEGPTHHQRSTSNNPRALQNQPHQQPQTSQHRPVGSTTTPSAATTPDQAHPAPTAAPEQPAAGAPLVPSSRGARLVEDEIIQPNVLILGEDIYGEQTYTEPVIGE